MESAPLLVPDSSPRDTLPIKCLWYVLHVSYLIQDALRRLVVMDDQTRALTDLQAEMERLKQRVAELEEANQQLRRQYDQLHQQLEDTARKPPSPENLQEK